MAKYPFEASASELKKDIGRFVEATFECLTSEFLIMPRGVGFVEYPVFERGYEALKKVTGNFQKFESDRILEKLWVEPISFIVLRTILGFSPPEWAYVASQKKGLDISQGFARTLDRKIRIAPEKPLSANGESGKKIVALVETACDLIVEGVSEVLDTQVHRLDKTDTATGLDSVKQVAGMGVPYAVLLYERFLGRPFASHRDSVSELVGDPLESAIEDVLSKSGISYRKTKRAERVAGFDQVPDFIIPSEFNPQVIIEAKVTEDDGTARDKATRIQHLGELSLAGRSPENPKYEVIACIGGRGFAIRKEDMKKMILATRGKIFTQKTLAKLVDCTRLKEFRT